RRLILLGIVICAGVVIHGCATAPTTAQRLAKAPRDGRLITPTGLPGQLAIVYSYRSEVNLGGFERLHPGDIHRQGRIFNALINAAICRAEQVFVPEPATDQQLLAVHDAAYLAELKESNQIARVLEAPGIGLMPDGWANGGVVEPFRYSTGGTLLAADLAMKHGLAVNLGGGFQHAFRDHGEGFCMFADVPLAIHTLRAAKRISRAMIVDCDIHHENGFARYYTADKDVAIFDIYEQDNYPAIKVAETYARPIPRGISEADYLALLRRDLPKAIDEFKPDVLFYVAGVDPLEGDALGHAKLSIRGLVERDLFVIGESRKRNIPTVVTLGGGYHPRGWQATYRAIAAIVTGNDPGEPGTK
ncbi:MAG: histone deacetylase, partial [Phycisphaerae bacterium]|nr:histone deacetylase [Phycisphaerae bacterium]